MNLLNFKYFKLKKSISPLIATILLVVVAVVLVTVVLNWGKGFTDQSLNKTKNFAEFSQSDIDDYIYVSESKDDLIKMNYTPPEDLKEEDTNIIAYSILGVDDIVYLTEPIDLNNIGSAINLECYDQLNIPTRRYDLKLYTSNDKYITIQNLNNLSHDCTTGGSGSEADPYIICSADDLNNVRNDLDANYALGKDVDLKCFSRETEEGWMPITRDSPRFTGNFYGRNHTINNLYINRPSRTYISFFGCTEDSEIKNLGLEDVNITAGSYAIGGLLSGDSYNDNGIISNIYVTGNIYSEGSTGLISPFLYGTLLNSYAKGNIYASGNSVGGLIGGSNGGHVINSYFSGSVSGGLYVGGLIGMFSEEGGSTITNSYSTGVVSGNVNNVGGLVGYNGDGSVLNSYWDTETSGQSTSPVGTGKTTTEMKQQSTFTNWDFDTNWSIDEGVSYPYLQNNEQTPHPE